MTIFNLGGGGGGSAAYYIRVRVSGSAGTPDLSGIQVTATSSGRPTVTGTTDSTGECYLSVRQGATYTVALSKQYYTFSPASQQATTSEPVTDLTATCYVQPSITVNVGGVDISGRTVTLTPSSGSAVSQVTGSSGSVTRREDPTPSLSRSSPSRPSRSRCRPRPATYPAGQSLPRRHREATQ